MVRNQYNSQKSILRQNIKSRFHVVLEQTNNNNKEL